MQYIEIDSKYQKNLDKILHEYPLVKKIAQAIDKHGGTTLLVGGAVRDLLLNLLVKDLDIEVHGISLNDLEKILAKFGTLSKVGKAFGVLRIHGLDTDWSVPRTDAAGRKPKVSIDPYMDVNHAFARRDLTINAMGIDLLSKKLIDPFDGYADLQQGVLRAPDNKRFVEDPLRFFRVMQFVGRFGFKPNKQLNMLCKKMDLSTISRERIETEFEKLLLKSKKPSLGFRWLAGIGRLQDVLPELAATEGVPQEKKWHPEGDVFEHTMQSLDAAAQFEYETNAQKLVLLYAALCHDLGKVTTTEKINGDVKSLGHELESARFAKKMLKRVTHKKDLIATVVKLVRYHMQPIQLLNGNAKPSAYKRLANKLSPEATLRMLAMLMLADKQGRSKVKGKPLTKQFSDVKKFLQKAEKAQVADKAEKPILQGRDLLDVIKPGPQLGLLIKQAYEIQIKEGIKDKKELKKRVIKSD
jgi:tRNA nucleotidyltransferase (CCA-adding enzyme)